MNSNLLDIWNLNSLWRLLSSITVGDKISIRGTLIQVDRNTTFLFLKRKYYGDKRDDVHQFINYLFEITEYHLKEENHIKQNVDSFMQNILSGIRALLNLRETYNDDVRFLSIYNSSLEKISLLKKYYSKNNNELKVFQDIESKIFMKQSPVISFNKNTHPININNENINESDESFRTPND